MTCVYSALYGAWTVGSSQGTGIKRVHAQGDKSTGMNFHRHIPKRTCLYLAIIFIAVRDDGRVYSLRARHRAAS